MRQKLRAGITAIVLLSIAATLGAVLGLRTPRSGNRGGPVVPLGPPATEREAERVRPRGPVLEIVVVDGFGSPLPDASVRVSEELDPAYLPDNESRSAEVLTDAAGRAVVALIRLAVHRVEVCKRGYASRRLITAATKATIALDREGALMGCVYEVEGGQAVEGVVIRCVPLGAVEEAWTTESGRDGMYRRGGLSPGLYELGIRPRRHVPYEIRRVAIRAGEATRIDVPVSVGLSLRGRVVDMDTGMPITSGRILANAWPAMTKETSINSDGSFLIEGLRIPPTLYRVCSPGWSNSWMLASQPPQRTSDRAQTQPVIVRVQRAATLSGTVLGHGQKPVAHASVAYAPRSVIKQAARGTRPRLALSSPMVSTWTDAEGHFVLPLQVPRPRGEILVRHPAYAPHWERGSFGEETEICLSSGSTLDVTATDAVGVPEIGAECRMLLRDPRRPGRKGYSILDGVRSPAVTDQEGKAVVDRLCSGDWLLEVRSRDWRRVAKVEVRIPGEGSYYKSVVLETADRVFGTVRTASGLPCSAVTVRLGSDPPRQVVTDEAGRFEFKCVGEGPMELTVLGHGLRGIKRLPATRGTPIDIIVEEPAAVAHVTGRVADIESGVPVAWGSIRIQRSTREATPRGGANRLFAGGYFWLPLPQGRKLTVTFTARGYENVAMTAEQLLNMGEHPEILMRRHDTLEPSDVSRLRVRVASDETGLRLVAYDAKTKERLPPLFRRSLSEYTFRWPGSLSLVLVANSSGGYIDRPIRCELRPGEETAIDLQLTPGGGRITGRIIDGGALEIVMVKDSYGLVHTYSAGADGRFSSRRLAPGFYSARTRNGEWQQVQLGDGQDLIVELRLGDRKRK